MSPVLWIVVVVVAVILAGFVMFNRLVTLRNLVSSSWHGIDVELQRRHDLIPNLVATVQGYAAHERAVLEEVTAARTSALAAGDGAAAKRDAEQQVSTSLRNLFAVAEGYPDLLASTNFLALQEELTSTEDRLALARRVYNANVQTYNTTVQRVPSNLIAKLGHFVPAAFFRVDPAIVGVPPAVPGVGSPG